MKAMQKFVHLCLVVTILLATMGFRVNIEHCAKEVESSISLFADPSCCCGKAAKAPTKSCPDIACIIQQGVATPANFNSSSQQEVKLLPEPVLYLHFTQSIRPALLERIPHFTLPPPISGRFIGILLQIFII